MAPTAKDPINMRHRVLTIAAVFLFVQVFGALFHSHADEYQHQDDSECHICFAIHEPVVDPPNFVSVFIPCLIFDAELTRIPSAALRSDLTYVVRSRGPPAA